MAIKFEIYSQGICAMSVCTNLATRRAIAERANQENPTMIASPWRVSRKQTFRDGEPHPKVCENDPTCQHWLLNC